MLLSKFDEEQRRLLAGLFVHPGWPLIKAEFELRKQQLINQLVYGTNRDADHISRSSIAAMDMVVKLEKEIFAPPPADSDAPFEIPRAPSVNRY